MQEIARFLATHPPFDGLSPEALEQAAATVEIAYFPGGATILRQGGEPSRYLHVIVKGPATPGAGPGSPRRPQGGLGPGRALAHLDLRAARPRYQGGPG